MIETKDEKLKRLIHDYRSCYHRMWVCYENGESRNDIEEAEKDFEYAEDQLNEYFERKGL